MTRKYTLQRRAQRQAETRQRIIEAAVTLHQTVGGAKATISAIAELAGVERLTVYRHFPDERSLALACTRHYQAANPPPDPEPWQRIVDTEQRLLQGLTEVYAYHRSTEAMSRQAERDLDEHPALREALAPSFAYWEQARDMLVAGMGPHNAADVRRVDRLRAAIGHAISFSTWRSLVREQGLEDREAVDLMVGMLRCLAASAEEHSSAKPRLPLR